jgi:methionine synthase II (cobalamin-independent)
MKPFQPDSRAVLIGSLPMDDHEKAIELVLKYTPDIPLWVQLPRYKQEGMIAQFLPGFPGAREESGKVFIDSANAAFSDQLVEFYEAYMAVTEGRASLDDSPFKLTPDTARGFYEFQERVKLLSPVPVALKGQITGPFTFATSVTDQDDRAIFYDDQLKDVAVKLLAQKAKWQVQQMAAFDRPVIIFFDEPALAGFGSSAFTSISRDQIEACFEEVIEAVHSEGGLAGVHVCANTDWSLILDSTADILSFDAYAYFDRFILYADSIRKFMLRGGIIAWGIVPTSSAEHIERETVDSLSANWSRKVEALAAAGIDKQTIFSQSLITPSCGTGSLGLAHATRVLQLTQEVSERIRG